MAVEPEKACWELVEDVMREPASISEMKAFAATLGIAYAQLVVDLGQSSLTWKDALCVIYSP